MIDENFYTAFENYFRGSRELIKSRLKVYLPFVLPLKHFYVNSLSVDLGCGRGEWLELMQENGIDVQGIDLDPGMLELARECQLNVLSGDVIESLQSYDSESRMVVTAFHLVEHLPFEQLHVLIKESLRVLKPGGLLILETPNPENIVVSTSSFYFDPTHIRPIPSELLSFTIEYLGFVKVKIIKLNEDVNLSDSEERSLFNVLSGVSRDYAVVAQKIGAENILAATDSAFNVEFGMGIESVSNSYDKLIKDKLQQTEDRAIQAEALALQAKEQAYRTELALTAIYNSTSWKMTAPFRLLYPAAGKIKDLRKVGKGIIIELLKMVLRYSKRRITNNPRLLLILTNILNKFPSIKARLKRAVESSGRRVKVETQLENLTPHGLRIYRDLYAATESRDKECR